MTTATTSRLTPREALAALASPRRGREGAAAAASWRNRVRAIVRAL